MEAGSRKEMTFVLAGNVVTLSFLWILVARYHMVKGKSVRKGVKTLLVILTVLCLFVIIYNALSF
jgi:hypothetical protein